MRNVASRILPCLALLVLPALASAEGARRYFDCEVTQRCDAAGNCTAASDTVSFEQEPLEVGDDGAGRYQLRYGDVDAEMTAVSEAGPFHWQVGTEQHTLLVSAETLFLWHQLDLSGAPAGISFLTCSIRF